MSDDIGMSTSGRGEGPPSDTTTNPRCDRELGTPVFVVVEDFELSGFVDSAPVFSGCR